MVGLLSSWETKGTEATVGQSYVNPFAPTPDVNGHISASDAVIFKGRDETIVQQPEIKPIEPMH
jgi:hypothetical protein